MADELPPIVLVGGFLTKNSQSYWGDVEQFFNTEGNRRRVFIAPVGACSSLHDRACEIFYSLKGGRIDYGADHAQTHKHGRYGRKYAKGLYPEWSIDHPVHFVTHSLGGPTVIKLISLLRSNFFGKEFHPDMVRSLFAVAAPFKGTPTVYILGASYNSDQYTLRPLSVGNFISKYIHISSFLGPLLPHNPEAFDFQPDSRNLGIFSLPHRPADDEEPSQPKRTWSALKRSVGTLLSNLRQSEWADTSDTGSHDSGFHAAEAREKAGENELNPGTFYCSLTGSITTKHSGSNHHRPHRSFRSDVFMYIMAKMLGSFSYNLSPIPDFLFEKPAPTPVTILSTPEPGRLRRPLLKRRTLTTTTTSFAPIDEEEDDSLADMADLSSMGLHRRVASSESAVSASSMSGSSGWNSSTRSSYESVRPVSVCSESSEERLSTSSLVPPHARRHSRRWSSTDWYAQWAEKWSEVEANNGELTPSAYDTTLPPTAADMKTEEREDGKKLRQDLWENDGVVPCFSQHHPSECSIHHCQHHGNLDLSDDSSSSSSSSCNNLRIGSFIKGVWHVFKADGMPHDSFVGGLAKYESQRANLWKKISESMQDLDLSPLTNPITNENSPHDDYSDASFQFKTPVDDEVGFLETTVCDTTFMVTPPSPVVERVGRY